MARYQVTASEQSMIDHLTDAGFHVMRKRSYQALRERLRVAEVAVEMEVERRQGVEQWAHRCLDDDQRLMDRLNRVCYAATSLGVPIQAINAALDGSAPEPQ